MFQHIYPRPRTFRQRRKHSLSTTHLHRLGTFLSQIPSQPAHFLPARRRAASAIGGLLE